jgi:Fe-S cluster assembly protein SufD
MTITLTPSAAATNLLDGPLGAFELFEKQFPAPCPPWLRALRTSGISYFAELGLPTKAHEDWRFTDPETLAAFPFVPALLPNPSLPAVSALQPFLLEPGSAHRLVFVDGHHAPELSAVGPCPAGLVISSLAEAIRQQPALVAGCLGHAARHETQAWTALNSAFVQDGAFIYVPPGLKLAEPIHLLFLATRPGLVIQPRNVVVARARSQAQVVEDWVSLTEGACFTNAVTEIMAGGSAQLEHLAVQRENQESLHVATVEARQHRDSRVLSHSIALGGRLTRRNINLRFEQPGCDSLLNGLYLADGRQLVDHHTIADHLSAHCQSQELYHGILGGKARGVFNGKIYVRQDAQKTQAKQTNRNLLLSAEATIHTKPQLEILADDVKCTHGATVGQLDEEAVFYLRSRGLGEAQARSLLVKAFASDVLNRVRIQGVRPRLEQWLAERLTDA